ncbi:MAG: nuclear transport factor 2 family protein [Acidimicrobiales bacterium]
MTFTEAYAAVLNLVYRYPELIDSGDFEGIGRLFEHATINTGDGVPCVGATAIQEMYERNTRRYPDTGTPHTRHVITNPIVEIDEATGTAICRSYVVVFQQVDDFPLQPVWTNRYEDRFRLVDGAWRFESKTMSDHMPGDVSRHLLLTPGL